MKGLAIRDTATDSVGDVAAHLVAQEMDADDIWRVSTPQWKLCVLQRTVFKQANLFPVLP